MQYNTPMKRLMLILAILAQPALADYNLNGKIIDCYCTDSQGARVDVGETICMHVDGRSFMAQCQMSLNVPIWREVSPACLSSRLDPSIGGQSTDPALDPLSVDTKVPPSKS